MGIIEKQGTMNVKTAVSTALNKRVSLKALGLMVLMLTLTYNNEITVSHLMTISGSGRDAVRTGLKELEDAGMFIKTQLHKEDGSFDGYKYILKW